VVIANASLPEARDAALDFGRRGWFVVLAGASDIALHELRKYIQMSGGVAHVVSADPKTREGRRRLIHEATSWFGHVDKWIDDGRTTESETTHNGKWKPLLFAASAAVTVGFIASRLQRQKE
jgi:hypothetical protein